MVRSWLLPEPSQTSPTSSLTLPPRPSASGKGLPYTCEAEAHGAQGRESVDCRRPRWVVVRVPHVLLQMDDRSPRPAVQGERSNRTPGGLARSFVRLTLGVLVHISPGDRVGTRFPSCRTQLDFDVIPEEWVVVVGFMGSAHCSTLPVLVRLPLRLCCCRVAD